MTYRAIKVSTTQAGCGRSFRETRWFVECVETGKIMGDVGPAKYADVAVIAESIAQRMNERAAA